MRGCWRAIPRARPSSRGGATRTNEFGPRQQEDAERGAKLWFELVNNKGPSTFDVQRVALRRVWLDNTNARRPDAPPPEPLTCLQLGAITTPTLAVGAEFGMPYSRRIVDMLARCIPISRVVVIPSVTHFMSYQAPAVFNRAVLDFLARH